MVLKAMGHAISKAVTVAEVLKHRVAGLHQVTQLSSVETVDVFEPLEEGLDRVESKRHIPGICIRLSLDPLDEGDPGYQAPLPASQVSPPLASTRGHRGGGGELKPSRRSRSARGEKSGGQQEDEANTDEEAAVADQEPDDEHVEERGIAAMDKARGGKRGSGGRGRGRGRGRVRGGRGGRVAVDGDSLADSTDRGANDLSSSAAAPADGSDAVPLTAAASGKKSGRGRRSGKKKTSPAGDGDTSKERHADADGKNDRGSEDPARDGGRSRGRGGRGRGRDRTARREPKTATEVTEGPAAAAAD